RETIPRLSGGTGKNELASSIMSRARRVPFAAAPCTLDMMRPVRNMLVPPLPWGMVLLRSAGIAVPIFAWELSQFIKIRIPVFVGPFLCKLSFDVSAPLYSVKALDARFLFVIFHGL